MIADLYAGLIKFCRDKGERHPPTKEDFGRALVKFCPARDKGTRTLRTGGDDGHWIMKTGKAYWLPPLAVCRAAFEAYLKQKIEWEDEE